MLRRAAEKDLPVAELAKSFEPDVDGPKDLATSATAGKNSSAARLNECARRDPPCRKTIVSGILDWR